MNTTTHSHLQEVIKELAEHNHYSVVKTSNGFIKEGIECHGRCCTDGPSYCYEPCGDYNRLNEKLKEAYEAHFKNVAESSNYECKDSLNIFFSPEAVKKIIELRWKNFSACSEGGQHNFKDLSDNSEQVCGVCTFEQNLNPRAILYESTYDNPLKHPTIYFFHKLGEFPELSFMKDVHDQQTLFQTIRNSFYQICKKCSFVACKICTNLSGLLNAEDEERELYLCSSPSFREKYYLSEETHPDEEIYKALQEKNGDYDEAFKSIMSEEDWKYYYEQKAPRLFRDTFASYEHINYPDDIADEIAKLWLENKDEELTMDLIKIKYSELTLRIPQFRKHFDGADFLTDEEILKYITEAENNYVKYAYKLMAKDQSLYEKFSEISKNEDYEGKLNIFFPPQAIRSIILKRMTSSGCTHEYDENKLEGNNCSCCKFNILFDEKFHHYDHPASEHVVEFKKKFREEVVEVQDLINDYGSYFEDFKFKECKKCSGKVCEICYYIYALNN
jgi:hypothetical protein